ncbi:MAG: hypothetical protein K0Q73_5631 [Paenibacillus sp.]|jgi:hypothetical protein|nr:hypothetical protein [Paenibacillus sp.]
MGMGPGQPAKDCNDEELVAEFESACRGGDSEFAPEYRDEILRRLSDNERLRRALGRIGFYCAGTEFNNFSEFVLRVKSGEQI